MSEKILVISPYPKKGSLYSHKTSAASSYTKNLLSSLNEGSGDFTVLADKSGKPEIYKSGNVEVRSVWKQNSLALYPRLLFEAVKRFRARKVLISYEWFVFGRSFLYPLFFPLFLSILALIGKKNYLLSHAVALDFSKISEKENAPKIVKKTVNFLLKNYYFLLILFSQEFIVFEERLRNDLIDLFPFFRKKIHFIPHGVDQVKNFSKKGVRKTKSKFVITVFGFLARYKGSLAIAKIFKEMIEKGLVASDVYMVFAGGANEKHLSNRDYKKYINSIKKIASLSSGHIKITGFVPEEDIGKYYLSSDLVLVSHRSLISSSGPLSFAFSYKKPILFSGSLTDYFESNDMKEGLAESGLKVKDISYRNPVDLAKKINLLSSNSEYLSRVKKFSTIMRDERSWKKVGEKYGRLLNI